ncbi:MAG: molybdopterin-dependent oxidoreductase [Candidatus Sericytochromatia bacterium]|uniref:Molybdopterin-dependent oxidoreductase n=1 Tax=Candidatus Tanganyikabacteria bacterium TaxID=2961651 RepID=A0A937X3R0_9BACT|nr:molybdopterin-dependent oxidoreductase [Candidatus Tanganyikabacteria bacterium]
MARTHFRTCNLCEAMCGLAIELDGARIAGIRGDKEDVFSRGHICPKAVALQDIQDDPDRLRTPLIREGDTWREATWDDALRLTADRLCAIRRRHGREAIAFYQGNPTVHNYGSLLYGQIFSRSLGGHARFSATSVDQLPHQVAAYAMFGHQALLPVPDIDHTRFFLMLGANPAASNGSLMSAPDIAGRLAKVRERGGKVILLDPRRTETARLADEHHYIRPGTDALFLFALVFVLFEEGLTAPGRLGGFTDGFEALRDAAQAFPPERVTGATGIAASEIRRLARSFAASAPAACYGRVGVSTQPFGGLAVWLINAINVITGNLDAEGGVRFTTPAADLVDILDRNGSRGHFAKRRSRVRGLPEFSGEWPAAILAEEIETPGPGQIRAMVTSAGNPVLSTPNGRRLDAALAGLDFMVSIDFHRNETTRHAHVILPPTAPLEHDHFDLAFHALAVRNTVKYSPPLFPRPECARHDWEIFLALATRLEADKGGLAPVAARLRNGMLRCLGPHGMVDLFLRFGPYGSRLMPWGRGLTLRRVAAFPHGLDLGPLRQTLPERLYTPGKRIALAPALLLADVSRLEAFLADWKADPERLLLIGRRDLRSNNSWLHNSLRLVRGERRCTLRMHPADAASRSLTTGKNVIIRSRVGEIEVTLEVRDDIMPGVVSLPHGWGHARPGTRLQVAEAHPGVSLNDLTDDQAVDALCGTAAFCGLPVTVEALSRNRETPVPERNSQAPESDKPSHRW